MNLKNFDINKLKNEILIIEEKSNKFFSYTDETCICWRVWGKGKPIILLHGGYGSWKHWIKQIHNFSKKYSVYIPDMPGFGESKDLEPPHTAEKIAKNIYQTFLKITQDGLDKINIFGFSFGGLIAGHLSYQFLKKKIYPENLILVGPGGLGAKRGPMQEMVKRTKEMTYEEILNAHLKNLEILMFANPKNIDELSLYIQLHNTKNHRIKSRAISATDTLAKVLVNQKIPIYAIWGEKDSTVGPYLEDRFSILRKINPNIRLHVELNAGHWIMYETPEKFNKIMSTILD